MDPGRVFYVSKAKGVSGLVYHILDSDQTTRLYTIETSLDSKPHMTATRHPQPSYQSYQQVHPAHQYAPFFPPPYNAAPPAQVSFSGPEDTFVGTVNFHSLSSKIDVSLTSGPQPMNMTMKRPDSLASGRKFDSPLGKLQWKEDKLFSSNQKLVDQYKRVIARYEKQMSLFSRKMARLILLVQEPNVLANLDMIIVTGLASIEYGRRSDKELEEAGEEVIGALFGV